MEKLVFNTCMLSLYFRILSVQHSYLLMTSYCTMFGENPNKFDSQEWCCWAFSTWDFWHLIRSLGFSCYISFSLLFSLFFILEMRVIVIMRVENLYDMSPYPRSAWCYFSFKLCIAFWTDKWLNWQTVEVCFLERQYRKQDNHLLFWACYFNAFQGYNPIPIMT